MKIKRPRICKSCGSFHIVHIRQQEGGEGRSICICLIVCACICICVSVFVWIFSLVSNPELIAILPEGQRFEIFFPDDWWIFCFALILNFHLWASSHPKILLDVLTQIRYLANISNIGNHGNFPHHLWPQRKKFVLESQTSSTEFLVAWLPAGCHGCRLLAWNWSLQLNYVSTQLFNQGEILKGEKQKILKTLNSLPLARIFRQCAVDFTEWLKIFLYPFTHLIFIFPGMSGSQRCV